MPILATTLAIIATAGMALLSWSQRDATRAGASDTNIAGLLEDVSRLQLWARDTSDLINTVVTEVRVRAEQGKEDRERVERQLQHLIERQDEMWQYFKRNGNGNGPRT